MSKLSLYFSGSAFSYDYRDEVMNPIQESILKDAKNMKFTKLSRLLPYMNTVMVSNLIVASILDKLVFGQRYFELYPIWYPRSVARSLLVGEVALFKGGKIYKIRGDGSGSYSRLVGLTRSYN